jgi:hypothetical protein
VTPAAGETRMDVTGAASNDGFGSIDFALQPTELIREINY